MLRSLLLVGLLATTARAQVATDTVRGDGRAGLFVNRVLFSTLTSTLVSVYPIGIALYMAEPAPMIGAAGIYLSLVSLSTAVVTGRQSGCDYSERFQRSLAGGLVGLGVATMTFRAVHGTHMKGMGAVIPVSAILLATPVGAAAGASQCDRARDHRLR
jgi:hypothetical protein